MFNLFRSPREKTLKLKNFISWAKRFEVAGYNFALHNKLNTQMLAAYNRLETSEQKLFAAYTSFSPLLKNAVKDELDDLTSLGKINTLRSVRDVLRDQGNYGLVHLLEVDYRKEFDAIEEQIMQLAYEPLPKSWLKEDLTQEQLADEYQNIYGTPIEEHSRVDWVSSKEGADWSRVLKLLKKGNCGIKAYDSGFSKGFALVQNGQTIADINTIHYRRAK